MEKHNWKEDLYIYRDGIGAPPKKDDLQEYIDLYCAEKDEKYFGWFLYYYEPRLNTKAMALAREFSMSGHFIDLKQEIVIGMLKALRKYDPSVGVPFLIFKEIYVRVEVDEYIRTMRHGYTMQSADEQKIARKVIALWRERGEKSDNETIRGIAAAIGRSEKVTREILRCAVDNTRSVDFYRRYADDDGDGTAEDVTYDSETNPERVCLRLWREEAVLGAYEKLNYREREMIAGHLGFCSTCFSVMEKSKDGDGKPIKVFRKKKAFADLAAEHTLSSPDTAFCICRGGYDKMMIDLARGGFIHYVELRLKSRTSAVVVYEYRADHDGSWGEIRYAPGDDDYDIVHYVDADIKGGFFFASAGEWIMWQAKRGKFPKRRLIVTEGL